MRARAITCALAAQAVALALGGAAFAAPVSHHRAGDAGRGGAILDYWTAERLRVAEPRTLRSEPAPRDAREPTATAAGRSPGSVQPAPPTVAPPAGGPTARPLPDGVGGTAYVASDSDLPPNTVHGRVFAKDRSGPFQCSATSVNSTNRSVLFTAGHCVRLKPFGWAKKFIFIPSYDEGSQPYGAWAWSSFHVARRWSRKQNSNYDFAAAVMSPRSGVAVQDAVGGAGFAWNQPRVQTYRSFGYPSNFFDGERMMGCMSTSRGGPDFGRGPQMQGMFCDMGKGSSGGGWLIDDRRLLNSVQSLGARNFSAGPYFGKSARRVLNRAQRQ